MGRWVWSVLIALDVLVNAVLGGRPMETISARAWRAKKAGRRWGRAVCAVLDGMESGHCEKAARDARARRS